MTLFTVLAIVAVSAVLTFFAAVLVGRYLARNAGHCPTVLESPRHPCYRCGEVLGETEYMGLHYCLMCRIVIVQTYQAVQHDPPYGFPGAPGYLDWPERLREKKKET